MQTKIEISNLSFGEAIKAVKQGKMISREGWNGKGMFVFQRPSDEIGLEQIVFIKSIPIQVKEFLIAKDLNEWPIEKGVKQIKFGAYLCMYAADGSIVNGWLASQTDILAEDWCVLELKERTR